MKRVFVFDLDDTLYPEEHYVASGFKAVGAWFAEHFGQQDVAARAWALFREGRRGDIFDRILAELGPTGAVPSVQDLVAVYRRHRPTIELFEDARWVLDRLQGKALGLISDGSLAAQRRKLDALGIAPRFRCVILTDAYGREFWKPHPRAFEAVAAQLGGATRQLVYVADNPEKDFLAPNRLGWMTIQVRRPVGGEYAGRQVTAERRAQMTIESLYELEPLLP